MSTRLDMWLVQQGVFSGRDTAKRHIAAGEVQVNGQVVRRPATPIGEQDTVTCDGGERYVGRGGYKLEKALSVADIPLVGAVALDVGASTGGFTDCMRQHGAKKVYAVDVGHGQLHPKLRDDPAVVCLENTDIRAADIREKIPDSPNVCAIDVSFISLKQVMPSVLDLLSEDATIVCLIKPQFEAGRAALGKHGVVKDPAAHTAVLRDLCAAFSEWGCGIEHLTYSPIRGGEGNVEYLAVLKRRAAGEAFDIPVLVREALSMS